ncbi:unnamed protein product [Effrenium voratum]|nr:unnamed protein product [Effrenium voratum]
MQRPRRFRAALTVAVAGSVWSRPFALPGPGWDFPGRREALRHANRAGLFSKLLDRYELGSELSEEELFWSREYGPGGSYEFWSLGEPKLEIESLAEQLTDIDGFSALVLGCGLGMDVSWLAFWMQSKVH